MDRYNDIDFQREKCYKGISKLRESQRLALMEALKFARAQHKGQARVDINRSSYIIHIYRVLSIVMQELGVRNTNILMAAALHDVVEDCGISVKELERRFGREVALMVGEESENLFSDRKTFIRHFREVPARVRLVKLADRIDNLRTLCHRVKWKNEKIAQYVIESERYILPISSRSGKAGRLISHLINRLKTTKKLSMAYDHALHNDKIGYRDTEWHR